jgi:hypothetical protein
MSVFIFLYLPPLFLRLNETRNKLLRCTEVVNGASPAPEVNFTSDEYRQTSGAVRSGVT